MEILLIALMCGAVVTGSMVFCSRRAVLARLAQNSGYSFERQKDTVTTALSAGKLELFTHYFHQFHNVLTFSTATSFMRLTDDLIVQDDNPKTKPIPVSLFSAEMRNTQFPFLKIAPISSPVSSSAHQPIKTNIAPIDTQYRIYADNSALTLLLPELLQLLQENQTIYLETNDLALIYHEHTLWAPQQLESFRFRALKILSAFEVALQQKQNPQEQDKTTSANRQRAERVLQSFAAARSVSSNSSNTPWHLIGFLVLAFLFIGISFLSWFALHNLVGR